MTPAQRKILELINTAKHEYRPIEYNFKSKTRVCERLVSMGFARPYAHGEYEITEAGRTALSETEDGVGK